jgi:hypothetical protein
MIPNSGSVGRESPVFRGKYSKTHGALLFFSIIAISVAATLNWRNSVWGYWISFATVGIADTMAG